VPTNPVGGWPGAGNTGPIGSLAPYTGPCTITAAGTVITSRIVNCPDLNVNAADVVIRNSAVNGSVDMNSTGTQILDSVVTGIAGQGTVDGAGFTIARSEIIGGHRGVWCDNCTVQDSWIHGTTVVPGNHASAVRADQYSNIIHNTLHCSAPTGYCSADQSGYPDFAPTHHWNIIGNLFVAFNGWYCAYGGDTQNKTYSDHPDNATFIVYRDNVFQRGNSGRCGESGGWAINSFNSTNTGNVWQNNRWDSGELVAPNH
jgi:hypothetical protein